MDRGTADPLYTGLAKQALFKGIPFTFWMIGFVVIMETFLLTRQFLITGAMALSLWVVGVAIGRKDPFFLRMLRIRLMKCEVTRNRAFWGGNHYQP